MTLTTQVLIQAPVDPIEFHQWVCEHLLRMPHLDREVEPGLLRNVGGQGADALVWTRWNADGGPYVWAGDSAEELEEYAASYPLGYVLLALDTPWGMEADIVHARMIHQLVRE